MSTFYIPHDEPLIKACLVKAMDQDLGSWRGLPIIAIGKNGGKIVGYDSKNQPIYWNSNQAKSLAKIKKREGQEKIDSTGEWLLALGIPNKIKGDAVIVQKESAELLKNHFPDLSSKKVGGAVKLLFSELYEHIGEPLTPSEEEKAGWAASMASGETEEDPFPDLSTLKEISAGKFAGSAIGHGANRLFVDPTGQKWVFKDSSMLIARAEEAACRIGRLIMGKEKIPPVRVVEINGEPGALIKVLPGDMMTESNHSNPPGKFLDKYRKDIARHFVVDWLISNHDAHGGNFLTQGDRLIGFDKGQAWKFFGEDPLDPNYQPNEHSTIYKKFWNEVKKGTIIDLVTVLPALGEALDAAERITPEQYTSIIAPYVTEATSGKKIDPKAKAKAMTARLGMLREDIKAYLSVLTGKTVQIPKKHGDNFETMPEVESANAAVIDMMKENPATYMGTYQVKKLLKVSEAEAKEILEDLTKKKVLKKKKLGPTTYGYILKDAAKILEEETIAFLEEQKGEKLTIKVPDKPLVIEGGPKEAIQTAEKVPGWPATKGKVTINHPGVPSPGGKWPKGYPGPGFSASITYKKQNYAVEFVAGPSGQPQVDVYYPDGVKKTWPSPNAASESMALYAKGLPMTMSSTEKQKQGISLPAKKFFGITAFKKELMLAHAGELAPAEMNPKELEDAGVVAKGAAELTVEAVMAKMPDGVLEDWDDLPHLIKESMLANDFMIGADYPAAIVPGWAYKTTEDGSPVIYFPKKPTTPGVIEYQVVEWEDGKMVTGVMHSASVDAIYNLDSNAWLQSIKKDIIQDLPQTADEKIGAAPKAEIPKDAVVPPDAPKEYDGPLPPGTSVTVKKKFPWGKMDVMLLAHVDGFDAAFFDADGNMQTQTFKSLSAACDWVWVNQKGYPDAATYKAEKKTNKIPSGGGWGFWGIKTKKKPKLSEKIPKTPEGKPGLESLDAFPADYALSAYPVGTTIIWKHDDGTMWKIKKVQPGAGEPMWAFYAPGAPMAVIPQEAITNSSTSKLAKDVKIKVPEVAPPVAPPTVEDDWMPLVGTISAASLQQMPDGAQIKQGDVIWEKVGSGVAGWQNSLGAFSSQAALQESLKGTEVQIKLSDLAPPEKPAEPNWETMPDLPVEDELNGMAVGTVLQFTSSTLGPLEIYRAEKLLEGKWKITTSEGESVQPSSYIETTIDLAKVNTETDGYDFSLEKKTPEAPMVPPAIEGYADPLAGLPTTWKPFTAEATVSWLKAQEEGTQLKVDDTIWVRTATPGLWKNTATGVSEVLGEFSKILKGKFGDIYLRSVDADKLVAQEKAVEAVTPVSDSAWQEVTKAPMVPWLSHQPEGTKIQFWNEALGDFVTVQKDEVGKWIVTNDPDDWLYTGDLVTMLPDSIKFKGSFSILEVGAAGVTPPPVEPEAAAEPSWADMKTMPGEADLEGHGTGTKIRFWNETGKIVDQAEKKADGSWWLDQDQTHVNSDTLSEILGATTEYKAGIAYQLWAIPKAPSEANWETMPEQKSGNDYIAQIDALPIGAQIKMTSKGTGKEWTAVKEYKHAYAVTGPAGTVYDKNEVGMGQFLVNMKDIKVKGKPTPATPEMLADPLHSKVAEAKVTIDVPDNIQDVELAIAGMVEGQELTWKELGITYKVMATGTGFNAMEMDGGTILATDAPGYEVTDNIDWSTGPTDFKLTVPASMAPKTKTVTVSTKEAVISEMSDKWGDNFFHKPSNKFEHTNIFLDHSDGVAKLKELAAKYGLSIKNKGGVPKKYYGKWMITVPDSELAKTTSTEVPTDGPVPASTEPSPALAEEKEEAKWVAVGAIGGKASKLLDTGYQFKWPEDVLPDDNVVDPVGPMPGATAAKIKAKGLKLVKGKKPKPKPELTPEQKAKLEKAKEVGEWLKNTPPVPGGKAPLVLAHFQNLFDLHKSGMKAWARSGGKGKLLLGSPDSEFADLMADMEKTQGLKTKKVDTPLGTFWEVKTSDLAKAIPGQPADTVKSPDGKVYPKGTTWKKETIPYTTGQLLAGEEGFYKITDHNTDPNLKAVKVKGTGGDRKQLLIDMLKKHNVSYDEPILGGQNWIAFVPATDLEKSAKVDVVYNAEVPPQPTPFISAPFPTMGAVKAGEPGISNRMDLANMADIDVGMTGHAVRMGAAGILRNGQVYVRKVRDVNGKFHYDIHGELEVGVFNANKSSLNASSYHGLTLPSAMIGTSGKKHNFEGGIHQEASHSTYTGTGHLGETANGAKVQVFGNQQPAFHNMFTVRIPEGTDLEAGLASAFESMGLDAGAAMREQTPDDERILKKSAIVKNKIGGVCWEKGADNPQFPAAKRFDEGWLDQKLKYLGVSKEQVDSARFQTTIANHQSVVIDDPEIAKSEKVKFVYIGMGMSAMFNQIVDGSGWCARTHYAFNGQLWGPGESGEQDIQKGGANVSFCRIGHTGNDNQSWGLACSGWKVVLHKRILNRTNWRFYRYDSYGSTADPEYFQYRRPREGVMGDDVDASNEVCFDAGIGVQDVAGIMAPSEQDKNALIKKFNDKGITEVNGIALDDLIQVTTNNYRSMMAQKFVGLKEGVLP